ncbi:MAG: hypothetical protein ACKO1L_05045 [Brachymonas sp.]
MKLRIVSAWTCALLLGLALDLAINAPSVAQVKKPMAEQRFPDVIATKVRSSAAGVFDFDVTLSSPYDTAQRYADAFRVTTLDGKVLGERILWHDHQEEQPFTRDLYGLRIPADVKKVIIQGRDKKHGYGGKAMEVNLPAR